MTFSKPGIVITSGVIGTIVGAVAGGIADSSHGHPVLKAALATGVIYTAISGLSVAAGAYDFIDKQPNGQLSGVPLRFP